MVVDKTLGFSKNKGKRSLGVVWATKMCRCSCCCNETTENLTPRPHEKAPWYPLDCNAARVNLRYLSTVALDQHVAPRSATPYRQLGSSSQSRQQDSQRDRFIWTWLVNPKKRSGAMEVELNDRPNASSSSREEVKGDEHLMSDGQDVANGAADVDLYQVEPLTRSQAWGLYVSHFLSTWNARTYEFAAVSPPHVRRSRCPTLIP